MAPNKKSGPSKSSGEKDNPENRATDNVSGGTPLTNRNWRRAPASTSAAAEHGSPSRQYIVDAEDTDDEDGDGENDASAEPYPEDIDVDENLSQLNLSDDIGVEVTTTPTGRYTTDVQKQSTSSERRVAAESTLSEYKNAQKYKVKKTHSSGSESFVQNAAGPRSDDPFSSAYKPPQRRIRQSHSAEVTPTSSRLNSRTQGMWRIHAVDSQDSESPTLAAQESRTEELTTEGRTRISGQNAQSHYSPSACIFVANLSSTETETELEAAVTKMFRRYGTVFVKIRRDPKNMPYAFCQFTDDADASHALEDSRGRLIHGRPVRTERARANRMYSFRRADGGLVTLEEARTALEQYGVIETIWYPTPEQAMMLRLQGAVLMQFVMFDAGRQAQQGVRNDGVFLLDSIVNLLQMTPRSSARRTQPRVQSSHQYLIEYEHDRNSIFISNLPPKFTEAQVRGVFEHYGTIVKVVIHQKPSQRNPGQLFAYGFVEYDDPIAPSRAIAAKNNFVLEGHALRVSAKDSEHRNSGSRSFTAMGTAASYRSPPAMHHQDASQQGYAPYGHGYMPTPPQYGFGAYYPPVYPASPWGFNWGNGYAYAAPPPAYHGVVAAAPTPNPMYNSAYPNQFDYNGQAYAQGSYGYPPYAPQGNAVATAPAQEYQTPADNDNTAAEEQNTETQ